MILPVILSQLHCFSHLVDRDWPEGIVQLGSVDGYFGSHVSVGHVVRDIHEAVGSGHVRPFCRFSRYLTEAVRMHRGRTELCTREFCAEIKRFTR